MRVGTEGSPGQLSLHISGFSTEVSGNPSLLGSPCSLPSGLSLGDQISTYLFEVSFMRVWPCVEKVMKDIRSFGLGKKHSS